ncbi:MAG: PDDEXK nuclease domain-containing protein, partial [Nostoc sp.]
EKRAKYGAAVIKRLSEDLTARFSKGFSERNLELMRRFYLEWQISQTLSAESNLSTLAQKFPLPWSHYVRLLSVQDLKAREFYETEALRAGWSERQLKRQIESKFYERVALSQNKTALLKKGEEKQIEDILTPEQELKDSFVLEFLGLKDEYSESDLEQALIDKLEYFLLELGSEFAFVARQKCLRVGDEWYRVDLLFFHRVLRCLIVIDLKLGKLTPADTGQMNFYVNYAKEHWIYPGKNPP